MENCIEIVLQDAETEEQFKLRLSPTTALKAQNVNNKDRHSVRTNLGFATTLLNVARQTCITNSPCIEMPEYVQTPKPNTLVEKIVDANIRIIRQEISKIICSNVKTDDADMSVSNNNEIKEENKENLDQNKENFRWSNAAILLLLEEYRSQEALISSGKISQKKAWEGIAKAMNAKGYHVTGKQCLTRINTMKRTYKTIKDQNSKSGNNRNTWQYYEIMESFLKEKPYITPISTVTSTGLITSNIKRPQSSPSSSSSSVCNSEHCDTIPRKRKATDVDRLIESRRVIEENKNKRHNERMEVENKFLEKLDKILEKM